MKIAVKKQPNCSACGPTVIQMITNYFKSPVSFAHISRLTKFKRSEGLSNTDIVNGLKELGYSVKTKTNVSWEQVKKLNTQDTVLVVSFMMEGYIGHVSLVEKVTDTHIILADPDEGEYIKIPKVQFLRLWMSYDDMWFPEKNTDIELRWLAIVLIPGFAQKRK